MLYNIDIFAYMTKIQCIQYIYRIYASSRMAGKVDKAMDEHLISVELYCNPTSYCFSWADLVVLQQQWNDDPIMNRLGLCLLRHVSRCVWALLASSLGGISSVPSGMDGGLWGNYWGIKVEVAQHQPRWGCWESNRHVHMNSIDLDRVFVYYLLCTCENAEVVMLFAIHAIYKLYTVVIRTCLH